MEALTAFGSLLVFALCDLIGQVARESVARTWRVDVHIYTSIIVCGAHILTGSLGGIFETESAAFSASGNTLRIPLSFIFLISVETVRIRNERERKNAICGWSEPECGFFPPAAAAAQSYHHFSFGSLIPLSIVCV